ncbi:phage major tail tube protein [Paenibacillus daejeonensis]|uniref:phage major tail tube protein n=1 Tax=Paenibacillus daejeonensis TaxID=135193 RepID=UPI0003792A3F|nr:phage major tail tube protein [Paenibacillus daejeonensis]
MQIPERLTNFTVYREGSEYLGVSDIVLPTLEAMTDTVSGAGIAGEVDSPTIGHFGSLTVTLNWRTVQQSTIRLLQQRSHALDFRGAIQVYDSANGSYRSQSVKVTVKAVPKGGTIGNMQPSSTMGSSNELEVTYLKIAIDNRELLELDKYNFIYRVDGFDALAQMRNQLGL